MAELTSIQFTGDWRVTVASRDAGWQQRVRATGTAAGTVTLNGVPGAFIDVHGNGQAAWTLQIEHNDGTSGWKPNWLQASSSFDGTHLEYLVASEDVTTSESDRDFNDLVVRLDKLGAIAQPMPPFAILPQNMQAMPEGIFEASLGRYFMAVRVENILTLAWPANARVGISDRCRAWLAAAGVTVIDSWSTNEQATFSQSVVGGRVGAGGLQPWAAKLLYFKVDVSGARARKHYVELQLFTDQSAEPVPLISSKAKAPIQVTRTTYDRARSAFVGECDHGTLTARLGELVVELSTFKRAMGAARKLMSSGSYPGGAGSPGGATSSGCDPRALERVRRLLRAFLDGKDVDLCSVWREFACCCADGGGGRPGSGGDDWTQYRDPGLGFFVWPTVVDYQIDYRPPFTGQYGPIPFDDPWWKILLIIIAIILSLAAAASSTADLANRSDDVVIGTLTRSLLNALTTKPTTKPAPADPGSVDAAVATLNGNRSLTPAVFTTLDAESGEFWTAMPIVGLGAKIDTPGSVLTNAQINAIFQNLADNPSDPAAMAALGAYKSGARSGVGVGAMTASLVPVSPRLDHDGNLLFLLNQIEFVQDADTTDSMSCAGDSGSLWFQLGTNSVIALNHAGPSDDSGTDGIGCRIEDVMNQLSIRFA